MSKDDGKRIDEVMFYLYAPPHAITMTDDKLLEIAKVVANSIYDGHYTLMKFTGSYKFIFGTPSSSQEIREAKEHATVKDAILDAIQSNLHIADQALQTGKSMFSQLHNLTKEERAEIDELLATSSEQD